MTRKKLVDSIPPLFKDTTATTRFVRGFKEVVKGKRSSQPLQRQVITTAYDYSGQVEIKIWQEYVDGNINHVEVAVDNDYVLIGGGARVTNTLNGLAGNALLTAEYPKNDGSFSTFVADSKDHIQSSYHRLMVYAIGMKLYTDPSRTQAIPTADIKAKMNLSTVTSSYAAHPSASVYAPSGYSLLAGGCHINWTGAGNLLVESKPINLTNGNYTGWYASGKDHGINSPATLDVYALSIENTPITNFGSLEIAGGYSGIKKNASGYTYTSVTEPTGWVISGIGASTDYAGLGRLLFEMYPYSGTIYEAGSKDHYYSDAGGYTWLYSIVLRKL